MAFTLKINGTPHEVDVESKGPMHRIYRGDCIRSVGSKLLHAAWGNVPADSAGRHCIYRSSTAKNAREFWAACPRSTGNGMAL